MMVHCDSAAIKKGDIDAWSAVDTVLSEILCASKREAGISAWMYLSLDKHGVVHNL